MGERDDIEHTLFTAQKCHVYRIPKFETVSGMKCAEWTDHILTARAKILSKGDTCVIRLEDPSNNTLFALCPINTDPNAPQAVETVTDSSRYFVLRIEDGRGHHAYIGCGFDERSTAFDFKSSIQDHNKYVERRKEEKKKQKSRLGDVSSVDFSLHEGERIKISLGKKRSNAPQMAPEVGTAKGNALNLSVDKEWGDFTSGTQQQQQQAQGTDDWVTF